MPNQLFLFEVDHETTMFVRTTYVVACTHQDAILAAVAHFKQEFKGTTEANIRKVERKHGVILAGAPSDTKAGPND